MDRDRRAGQGAWPRWKLVGNAVTVDVAAWVAGRLAAPGQVDVESREWDGPASWPSAAWGSDGKVWSVSISEYPLHAPYRHLLEVVDVDQAPALSSRGVLGFLRRLEQGNLGRHAGFRGDMAEHADVMGPQVTPLAI